MCALLNLASASNRSSGLVDGHLNGLLVVGHYDRSQRRIVGVHLRVVHRPEAVEEERLLVPGGRVHHCALRLVANYVVHSLQPHCRPAHSYS